MPIHGAIEQKNGRVISGWLAIVPGDARPTAIEVIVGGKKIGETVACQPRPDVRSAGFGDGNCGFTFMMPPEIGSREAEEAELRIVGTEIYLTKPKASAIEAKPPVATGSAFILGPARSGTSVVFLALQQVCGLDGLGESHAPQIFQRILYQFYQYVKQFAGDPGVLAARLSVPDLREELIAFLRRFYEKQYGRAPFVDKTPGLEAIVGAPFIQQAFPGAKIIVMERNGIEVIESYRKKFGASFEDALKEWSSCAVEISKLKQTMPEILFLSQNELRKNPERAAARIAEHLGRAERAAELAQFFRTSREDVLSDRSAWDSPPTMDGVEWSREQKQKYDSICLDLMLTV